MNVGVGLTVGVGVGGATAQPGRIVRDARRRAGERAVAARGGRAVEARDEVREAGDRAAARRDARTRGRDADQLAGEIVAAAAALVGAAARLADLGLGLRARRREHAAADLPSPGSGHAPACLPASVCARQWAFTASRLSASVVAAAASACWQRTIAFCVFGSAERERRVDELDPAA